MVKRKVADPPAVLEEEAAAEEEEEEAQQVEDVEGDGGDEVMHEEDEEEEDAGDLDEEGEEGDGEGGEEEEEEDEEEDADEDEGQMEEEEEGDGEEEAEEDGDEEEEDEEDEGEHEGDEEDEAEDEYADDAAQAQHGRADREGEEGGGMPMEDEEEDEPMDQSEHDAEEAIDQEFEAIEEAEEEGEAEEAEEEDQVHALDDADAADRGGRRMGPKRGSIRGGQRPPDKNRMSLYPQDYADYEPEESDAEAGDAVEEVDQGDSKESLYRIKENQKKLMEEHKLAEERESQLLKMTLDQEHDRKKKEKQQTEEEESLVTLSVVDEYWENESDKGDLRHTAADTNANGIPSGVVTPMEESEDEGADEGGGNRGGGGGQGGGGRGNERGERGARNQNRGKAYPEIEAVKRHGMKDEEHAVAEWNNTFLYKYGMGLPDLSRLQNKFITILVRAEDLSMENPAIVKREVYGSKEVYTEFSDVVAMLYHSNRVILPKTSRRMREYNHCFLDHRGFGWIRQGLPPDVSDFGGGLAVTIKVFGATFRGSFESSKAGYGYAQIRSQRWTENGRIMRVCKTPRAFDGLTLAELDLLKSRWPSTRHSHGGRKRFKPSPPPSTSCQHDLTIKWNFADEPSLAFSPAAMTDFSLFPENFSVTRMDDHVLYLDTQTDRFEICFHKNLSPEKAAEFARAKKGMATLQASPLVPPSVHPAGSEPPQSPSVGDPQGGGRSPRLPPFNAVTGAAPAGSPMVPEASPLPGGPMSDHGGAALGGLASPRGVGGGMPNSLGGSHVVRVARVKSPIHAEWATLKMKDAHRFGLPTEALDILFENVRACVSGIGGAGKG
uniref:Uncharacterized protein n=1 Tax=Chromera velia CCMP2878 TaxID=1169474 RepID=A0A0G4G518_9ALVE|eukprot:Cvel_570.t1-p1 / transcript=Cvel_570.t1 / gene=Cvel_570 / organism=Chromera_velia_CCMP2878 / gene_product=hypothetical protein / transcript_product=hypothetical protein / location=Cvel_scaffold17:190080-194599(+) / protein_length=834 / sequence_SO=supercontig / SO=protein_coding / is_pseudo=false